MSYERLILGAAGVIGAAEAYRRWTTSKHDRLLKKAYKKASRAADDAEVRAEHGIGGEEGNRDLDEIEGHPDLVVKGFSATNLIAEVETPDVLDNNPGHIIDQLEGYARQGYKRVLVVPSGATEAAKELCQDIEGDVVVSTPSGVADLV